MDITLQAPAVYTDFSGLSELKSQAEKNPDASVKEVARQFESIFVTMMLKSMRDAMPEDSLFGSDQMKAYQDMFDKQLALDLSGKGGIGLAELIEKQLSMSPGASGSGGNAAAEPGKK